MIPGSAWLGTATNVIEFTSLGIILNNTTDATSFVSDDTHSGTTNALNLLAVYNTKATLPDIPTISQTGATWVSIATVTISSTIRLTLFRQMGFVSAANITVDFGGNTQTGCIALLVLVKQVDTTGTNGSGAIVQTVTASDAGSPSAMTVTLAAFSNPYNATYGTFACDTSTPTAIGVGSGFSTVGSGTILTPNGAHLSEYKASNDTSVDCSLTTTTNALGIAIEIKANY